MFKKVICEQMLTIICLIGAAAIAASGHDGWGWMLCIAALFYHL